MASGATRGEPYINLTRRTSAPLDASNAPRCCHCSCAPSRATGSPRGASPRLAFFHGEPPRAWTLFPGPAPASGLRRDTSPKCACFPVAFSVRGPLPRPFPRLGGRVESHGLRNGPVVSQRWGATHFASHCPSFIRMDHLSARGFPPFPRGGARAGEGGRAPRIRTENKRISEKCPEASPLPEGTHGRRGTAANAPVDAAPGRAV